MGHETDNRQSFIRRIAKDPTANTIAISAASLVPLMAMVGGGVDASRYYMAETRLQAACDAGALAARRQMDDGQFTGQDKQVGLNFFDQNFEDGMFGTEELKRDFSVTDDDRVIGSATGTMPTSIMGAFGYEEFDLSVTCEADINISNTDVMFVVDVTGSMGCTADGTSCPGGDDPTSRLAALRSALMTFYDTVEDSTSDAAQIRYGVVPYASNVNVGNILYDENPAWLATSHTYQSREDDSFVGPWEEVSTSYNRTSGANTWDVQSTNSESFYTGSFDVCQQYVWDEAYQDVFVSTDEGTWTLTSQNSSNPRTTTYTGTVTFEFYGLTSGNYSGGNCNLNWQTVHYEATATISIVEEREEILQWRYGEVTWDLTTLYDDNSINLPTGWQGADETINWDGCVEEAETVTATNWDTVPVGAFDMNINLVPSQPEELWKPVLWGATWVRTADDNGDGTQENVQRELFQDWNEGRPWYSCPEEAFRLTDISRADLQDYVDDLEADGNTYHDLGMLWGARFISPNGIFAAANSTAPNGDAIARHIIFMTDGEPVPNTNFYNMYGIEWWDRRVTADTVGDDVLWETTRDNHEARFQAACRLARQENISVWVVAFGTTLTQNLIDCATDGRAFVATDADSLADTFEEIAQRIAALRLTQ